MAETMRIGRHSPCQPDVTAIGLGGQEDPERSTPLPLPAPNDGVYALGRAPRSRL